MSTLSIVLPAVLLLAAVVAIAGARGNLHRNRYFGLKFRAVLASDEAWVAGHRAAIGPAWVGFVVTAAVGLASWFEPSSPLQPLMIVLVVTFVAAVILVSIAARRGARSVTGTATR